MDCALIQGHLIGYQFGALADADRRVVEAHLLACSACLRTFIALKAQIDHGAGLAEGPSEAARVRLRAAVEERYRPTAARRFRRWLSRPVPLYQGLVVAAFVAIAAALAPPLARAFRSTGARPAERVDTTRPAAESLTIY
jgi:anti-sigma factor RsiW